MNTFEKFFRNLVNYGLEYFQLYYGIYRGNCTDNQDPEEQGRIMVRVPAITGNEAIGWAWPVAGWGGKDSGMFCVPDVGDPVYVIFEGGKVDHPIWMGGWFPKPEGENYAPQAYTNKIPSKRIFKTKAGHELSFEDDPANLSCKLVWHDPEKDIYSFFAFTKDGSIQFANHKGSFMEMRATDGDELVMIIDNNGNLYTSNKDGIKVADKSGCVVEMKEGTIQFISSKALVINTPSVNLKAGGVDVGDVATDKALKGTSYLAWWKATFLTWLTTHTHPTGVGPSGPPIAPLTPPVDAVVLSDKLKMQ